MFKISDSIPDRRTIGGRSIFNTSKHMLSRKEVYGNQAKDFCLMIYLFLYRISLEIGISILTPVEAVVMSALYLVIAFSVINQGAKLLFTILHSVYSLTTDIVWIYTNLDRIKTVMEQYDAENR